MEYVCKGKGGIHIQYNCETFAVTLIFTKVLRRRTFLSSDANSIAAMSLNLDLSLRICSVQESIEIDDLICNYNFKQW